MKLGIDFGTCFSFPAIVSRGRVESLCPKRTREENGIPSDLFYDNRSDSFVCGYEAYIKARNYGDNERNYVQSIKRKMVMAAKGDSGVFWSDRYTDKNLSAQQIATRVIEHVAEVACRSAEQLRIFDGSIEAVIGVPVMSSEMVKDCIKKAAENVPVGQMTLRVIGLLEEPVAAAYYVMTNDDLISDAVKKNGQKLLVYDFGGGTFDVALLEYTGNVSDVPFKVVRHDGDNLLGGRDCDIKLLELVRSKLGNRNISLSVHDQITLNQNIIEAKMELSVYEETKIEVKCENNDVERITVTKKEFEEAIRPLIDKTMEITKNVVGNDKDDVYAALLVGGSCRMPIVEERFNSEIHIPAATYDPDSAIAYGLAAYAEKINLTESVIDEPAIIDIPSVYTYGIECQDKKKATSYVSSLIKKGEYLPAEKSGNFVTANQTSTVGIKIYESELLDDVLALDKCTFVAKAMTYNFGNTVPEGHGVNVRFRLTRDGLLKVIVSDSENPFNKQEAEIDLIVNNQ